MHTLIKGEHTLILYDSIKELPIARYNAMQSFLVQDAGIGSRAEDVQQHFAQMFTQLQRKDVDAAYQELTNLYYNLVFALSRLDHKSGAFVCLIKSIDGEDMALPEGNSAVLLAVDQVSAAGVTEDDVRLILDEVKKNWMPN